MPGRLFFRRSVCRLIRLLKYLAFLLAVFGPGLYVMAVSFAPELIPVHLLAKLAQGEAPRRCRLCRKCWP
mgnify:CR=1 FL=1